MKDARKTVYGDGIAFKVFGPNLRSAYVSLGFGADGPDPDATKIMHFQWVAQAAHLRFCALSDAATPKSAHLTSRELEVISWVGMVKSNSVIADVMGISHHTVDTHMRRIYTKLGVTDRTSAALQAQRKGLLVQQSWV